MSVWNCPTHGLYGGDVFCPQCGGGGEYVTLSVPQEIIDETLEAMRTEDPATFKPYSQFREEVLAKIAASPAKPSIPNADGIATAIMEKYDALINARKSLAAQLIETERGIQSCQSAARVFGFTLPEAPRPAGALAGATAAEIVARMLEGAGHEGITVTEMRPAVESAYGAELHPKSVGVALQRMTKQGRAKCVARRWYAVLNGETPR